MTDIEARLREIDADIDHAVKSELRVGIGIIALSRAQALREIIRDLQAENRLARAVVEAAESFFSSHHCPDAEHGGPCYQEDDLQKALAAYHAGEKERTP